MVFKAAAVQMCSGVDPEKNAESMARLVREAHRRGAIYVQTPEMTGAVQKDRAGLAAVLRDEETDLIVKKASELAKELGIHLHVGSTAIKLADGKIANRAFLFGPDGHKITSYDKIHMFDVDLDIPRGQIFGLLGPNGAGKSTTINILAGLVNKSAGKVSIWGFDIDADPRNAKASIGIVPQEIVFDPFFTPRETLENTAGFYGIPKAKRHTDALLRAVHLHDKADAYARSLSGGMKRRLLVAKAMVHSPPVLVLDEPTAGVDVELRQQLWEYVRELNAGGVTVVLTTHYLEEAEELCDRIAIINHGKVIANEPTRDLVGKAQEKAVSVTVDRDLDAPPEAVCFEKVELKNSRTLVITYSKDKVNAGEVLAAVQRDGLGIVDVSTQEADLEDVFLALTRAANG